MTQATVPAGLTAAYAGYTGYTSVIPGAPATESRKTGANL